MKDDCMVQMERYYIKTRGRRFEKSVADLLGIKRIYNYTSDIDYMDTENLQAWSSGLYNADKGEAIIIESALREVNGVNLYVMSCIVFHTAEQSNIFFIRNRGTYTQTDGFLHLYN